MPITRMQLTIPMGAVVVHDVMVTVASLNDKCLHHGLCIPFSSDYSLSLPYPRVLDSKDRQHLKVAVIQRKGQATA